MTRALLPRSRGLCCMGERHECAWNTLEYWTKERTAAHNNSHTIFYNRQSVTQYSTIENIISGYAKYHDWPQNSADHGSSEAKDGVLATDIRENSLRIYVKLCETTYNIPKLNIAINPTLVALDIWRFQIVGNGSIKINRSTRTSKQARLIYAAFRFIQCPPMTMDQFKLIGWQKSSEINIVIRAHRVDITISTRALNTRSGVEKIRARDQHMLIFTNPSETA